MIDPSEASDLIRACEDIDSHPSLGDETAAAFIARFPVDVLFRIFSSTSELSPNHLHLVTSVVSRVLTKSQPGRDLLLRGGDTMPYLEAATKSPHVALRRLAAQLLGLLLSLSVLTTPHQPPGSMPLTSPTADDESTPSVEKESRRLSRHHTAADLLLGLMASDKDAGVAQECEGALAAWAAAIEGGNRATSFLMIQLAPLAESVHGNIRLRALSLVMSIIHKGDDDVARAVKQTGMLGKLLASELLPSPPSDPLSALSALGLVSSLVVACTTTSSPSPSSSPEKGKLALVAGEGQVCRVVAEALPGLLSDPLLRPLALECGADLLGGTFLAAATSPSAPDLPQREDAGGSADLKATLMRGLRDILGDSASAGPEDEVVALAALSRLARVGGRAASELILHGDTILTAAILDRAWVRPGSVSRQRVQIAALHALASLAAPTNHLPPGHGILHPLGLHSSSPAPRDWKKEASVVPAPPPLLSLSTQSEEALRVGIFQAASISSPGEILISILDRKPPAPTELRIATYLAAAALSNRPWFAAEACRGGGGGGGRVGRLLAPIDEMSALVGSEGIELQEARFTLIMALQTTATSALAAHPLAPGHPDAVHTATLAKAAKDIQAAFEPGPFAGAGSGVPLPAGKPSDGGPGVLVAGRLS